MWILNSDQSTSLIPKTGSRRPGITNFLIPDHGIEKSIPGLQSLMTSITTQTFKNNTEMDG